MGIMNRTATLGFYTAGAVVLSATSAFAATGCPQFLIAGGYADLCGPSAWMAFEHQSNQNNQILKRRPDRNGIGQPARSSKMKFRLRPGSRK